MFEYTKSTMTVRDFLLKHGDIDCNPIHQRLDREPKLIGTDSPSKAQGVISAMLMGMDIGQITIHETPEKKFQYESIDGGHRKRYIVAFHQNKFPDYTTGKYFRDMVKKEKDEFLNIELSFCIYKNLESWQVGLIFRALNETTPVNHQEMLNSYGDIPIANAIRETVRVVQGIGNATHPLFDYTERSTDSKKNYTYVSFDNDGLRIDEMVARIFYRYHDGGGLGVSAKEEIEALYSANIDDSQAIKLKKKVKTCLDFVLRMAVVRKPRMTNNMPQKEFVLFSRLWMFLEKEYGIFTINDDATFFDTIYAAYTPYKLSYDDQPAELQATSPLDSGKSIGKQFNDTLGEFRPAKSVAFPIERLMAEVDVLSLITPRDKQRIFPREWREAKIVEQNYKCAISGETITMDTAQGAHNIAWSDGGKTEYINLSMIATHHNSRMGSLSVQQYKELIQN